ncbi:MAG: hypothetical protein IPL28_22340 [Chloroflexi bacterium]|nr:hypothetical protein [Chloroflexota bacterium]
MYKPSLEEFNTLAQGETNLIPVYREFAADLETPVSVYLKLADEMRPSFLLESVEGGEQLGRYSFVGVNPRAVLSQHGRTITDQREKAHQDFELPNGRDLLHIPSRTNWPILCPPACPVCPALAGGRLATWATMSCASSRNCLKRPCPACPSPKPSFSCATPSSSSTMPATFCSSLPTHGWRGVATHKPSPPPM